MEANVQDLIDWRECSCRKKLQEADRQFIKKLGLNLDDLEMSLDSPKLLREMMESGVNTRISLGMYFYVIVRHTLLKFGIIQRDVADYVAGVLMKGVHVRRAFHNTISKGNTFYYVMENLQKIDRCEKNEEFFMRVALGNQTLFMTGVFEEHLAHRTERKGAPGIDYLESVGADMYMKARRHPLCEEFDLVSIFNALGARFAQFRAAISSMKGPLLNVG